MLSLQIVQAFVSLLDQIETGVNDLLASFKLGNVIKNGVNVAIIGKPNAGKSTLLNALLKENRAIVSAIAGTTRDTIEEVLNIDGILFRLIDTAGIREGADEVEAIGVEKSREKMKSADVVLYLFDASADTKLDVEAMQQELQLVAPFLDHDWQQSRFHRCHSWVCCVLRTERCSVYFCQAGS